MSCVNDELIRIGYDINDFKQRKAISHNEFNYILRRVYDRIFKPDKPLYNGQASKIDYDNMDQLQAVADSFITICSMYNKSLGLMSFSYMTGIASETIRQWLMDESNPQRVAILKYIQEGHKAAQVAILNDSPVGALAVANNDNETGLNWSRQQALEQANNAVFLIPSERVSRLNLEKVDS